MSFLKDAPAAPEAPISHPTTLPVVDPAFHHDAPANLPRVGPFYGFQKPAHRGFYLRDNHEKGLKLAYWDGVQWTRSVFRGNEVPHHFSRRKSKFQRLKWYGLDQAMLAQMEAKKAQADTDARELAQREAAARRKTEELLAKHRSL